MTVDAYTHCGLEKFRPIEDVRAMMAEVGITHAVLAQHLGQYDNSYIQACVMSAPQELVGVAMIDVADDEADRALAAVIDDPAFAGLRMTAAMLVQAPEVAGKALAAGLHLVLYCPDGTEPIEQVLPTLGDGPGRIVVTHLGSPVVQDGRLARGEEVLRLAGDPRVLVTLSGAGMACQYPHEPLRTLVRSIVSDFGAERVMWASNFPVVGEAPQVRDDLELLLGNDWGLSESDLGLIATQVAMRTWFSGRDDA